MQKCGKIDMRLLCCEEVLGDNNIIKYYKIIKIDFYKDTYKILYHLYKNDRKKDI